MSKKQFKEEFKKVQKRLEKEKLSMKELDMLAEIIDVGFLETRGQADRDEKILMLSTMPKKKVFACLKKLKDLKN